MPGVSGGGQHGGAAAGALASAKNLVLAKDGGTDRSGSAPFEFCKLDGDRYHCRYEAPLSAFEAFGIALAATIRKW